MLPFSTKVFISQLILFISICSSTQAQTKKVKKAVAIAVVDSPKISFKTKKFIQDTLVKSYYRKCLKDIKLYSDAVKVVVERVEGTVNIDYVGYKNEPTFAPTHQIPAIKNFIEGDLNNDNFNDLIVSVYYNQGSRPRLHIYCYITTNKKLKLHKMYTIHELGLCENGTDTSGRFFPGRIENGMLVGTVECLQDGDPGCCPSLEMDTYFKFDNGLKFVRQFKRKKS